MKIGIIGAGASGMMAAITAAEYQGEVTLIEKNDRVGKKILATGNGKCNISNLDFKTDYYYCSDKKKLQDTFSVFSVKELIAFFENNGMLVRNKNGYLYPYSEQASTVLDTFRRLLVNDRIKLVLEQEVTDAFYHKEKKKFIVKGNGNTFEFDRLIISCGGPASLKKGMGMTGFQIAEGFGHRILKVVPGLVQLKGSDSFLKAMAGVRTQAEIRLYANGKMKATEKGEVQFTDYGISGIPVFQLSRIAAYELEAGNKVQVLIDLFPDYDKEQFLHLIQSRFETMQNVTLEEFLTGTVNKKINLAMIKYMGLKPDMQVKRIPYDKIKKLLMAYRELTIHITAVNGMENAQVCAGGVDFREITTEMESTKRQGLFFTGEVIDVDGKCGGYNLQWAFSSGYIAGRNAAGSFTGELR